MDLFEPHAASSIGTLITRVVRDPTQFQANLDTIATKVFDNQASGAKDAVLTIAFLIHTTTVAVHSKALAIKLLEHLSLVDSEHCGSWIQKCGVLDLIKDLAESKHDVLKAITALGDRAEKSLKQLVSVASHFMAVWIQSQEGFGSVGTPSVCRTLDLRDSPPGRSQFVTTAMQGRRRPGSNSGDTLESRLTKAQDLCKTMVETIETGPSPDAEGGLNELRTALNELHESFQLEASKAVDEERMADFSRISRVVDELNQAIEVHNKHTAAESVAGSKKTDSPPKDEASSWFGATGSLQWEAPTAWGDIWADPPPEQSSKKSRKTKKHTSPPREPIQPEVTQSAESVSATRNFSGAVGGAPQFKFYSVDGTGGGDPGISVPSPDTSHFHAVSPNVSPHQGGSPARVFAPSGELQGARKTIESQRSKLRDLESQVDEEKRKNQELSHKLAKVQLALDESKKAAEHAKTMWMRESVRATSLNDSVREHLTALEARDEAIRSLQESEASLLRKVNQLQLLNATREESINSQTEINFVNAESSAATSPLAFEDRVCVRSKLGIDPPLLTGWSDGENLGAFRRLLCLDEGLLYVKPGIIEVGLRAKFEGPRCSFRLYYGNLSPGTLDEFSVQLKPFDTVGESDRSQHLDWRASPVPTCLIQGQQACQSVVATCTGPYTTIPMALVRFLLPDATPIHLVVRIPLPVTKFIVPYRLTGPKFFKRWRSPELVLNETTGSVSISPDLMQPLSKLTDVLQLGGSLDLHVGIDADPNNIVLIGTFPPPGDPTLPLYLVMVRFEVDRHHNRARIAVRSDSAILSQATRATLVTVCSK